MRQGLTLVKVVGEEGAIFEKVRNGDSDGSDKGS